jgi:hypothetical protein
MGFRHALFFLVASAPLLLAQFEALPEPQMTPKEAAIEQLLSERESREAFDLSVAAARKQGVAEQAILEGRFLYHVDLAEDAEIAALLPVFLERREKFEPADSEIFASEDDWLAVVEYVQAIAAMQNGDQPAFKKHITEAFWLSPSMGAVFAPHIDRMRLQEAMKKVKLNFDKTYRNILGEDELTLKQMSGERSGLLIHFWSPWSRESEDSLPDFLITAEYLSDKNIAVVSILPETSAKVVTDAKAMLGATAKKVSGNWIVDDQKAPLATELRVRTVPIMVILNKNGEVIFNGHPTDAEFWDSLRELNPDIQRPKIKAR